MTLRLELATEIPEAITTSELNNALATVQKFADITQDGSVSLAFVDELTARSLNNQFSGNDYATDVLSFNYFENEARLPTSDDILGEIVICIPVAQRQAMEYSSSFGAELMLLFVHGMLHIFGYDHNAGDEASFKALQGGIMDKLKVNSRDIFDGNVH